MSKNAGEDTGIGADAAGGPAIEDDEQAPPRRPGLYGRAKRAVRRRWKTYLNDAVPRDDDGPEDLPRLLQGRRGQVILAIGAVGIMCGWVVLAWVLLH